MKEEIATEVRRKCAAIGRIFYSLQRGIFDTPRADYVTLFERRSLGRTLEKLADRLACLMPTDRRSMLSSRSHRQPPTRSALVPQHPRRGAQPGRDPGP